MKAPYTPLSDRDATRAQRLYPDSYYLQGEYLRALVVVRRTRRGWLLERPLHPQPAPALVLTS